MPQNIPFRKAILCLLRIFYFLARNPLSSFSLPRSVILIHIIVDISAGSIFLYFSNSIDTTPNPLITIGTTTHSQSHIRPNSSLRPLYLVIFSCSFCVTLMSFGHAISIIKHFLFCLSRTTISGRLKTWGLSVARGVSHITSTFFKEMTSGGLWVCHLAQV